MATAELTAVARQLSVAVRELEFGAPVRYVYNPLDYAWKSHRIYLERFGQGLKEVVFLGMNPGPWGMAQTGVPFGEVEEVRDWLGIEAEVARPQHEHPRRPVEGFSCRRREVSGRRLWGWIRQRFGTPERFFSRFFVANYCPLMFLEGSGRNRTPDRLPLAERTPLTAICDSALRRTAEILRPRIVIGVGRFAERHARQALAGLPIEVGGILHPSPASPAANRDWPARATRQLAELGVKV